MPAPTALLADGESAASVVVTAALPEGIQRIAATTEFPAAAASPSVLTSSSSIRSSLSTTLPRNGTAIDSLASSSSSAAAAGAGALSQPPRDASAWADAISATMLANDRSRASASHYSINGNGSVLLTSAPAAPVEPLTLLSFVPSLAIVCPAMLSGASQAIFFNPVDRALYLRVIMRRSLFHPENWRNPFQGFANAGLHRMLSAGGYLCWQEVMRRIILGRLGSDVLERFSVGLSAGTVMGLSLNGLQFVKYRMWTEGNGNFTAVTKRLYSEAGVRIFFRGTRVGIMRDAVFGLTYEVLRGKRSTGSDPMNNVASSYFLRDTAAGCIACWTSAPLNYCRNIIYGIPPKACPLSVRQLLFNLYTESMQGGGTATQRWTVMNSRLNLGWAALRVGVGIAVGQQLFECYKYQYMRLVEGGRAPLTLQQK